MKNQQDNFPSLSALLRAADSVDTLETNSLCCEAAGIIAPSSATTEALIPHEKLRGAALADATLNAQERPPAQPALGYTHTSTNSESPSDWLDLNNIRPDQWLNPMLLRMPCAAEHTIEFGGQDAFALFVAAAQKRIAELEQVNLNLRDHANALVIDSNVANEQLQEVLLERDKTSTQPVTDTQLIDWLDQRGSFWCEFETSDITFPLDETDRQTYGHIRDALLEAYKQDLVKFSGGGV